LSAATDIDRGPPPDKGITMKSFPGVKRRSPLLLLFLPALLLVSCATNPKDLTVKHETFPTKDKAAHEPLDKARTHRYLQVGTVRWHCVEYGDPGGSTVLLLM
jgi:hypothetical protein